MKEIPDPFAFESPEKKALVDEIVHGAFVKEGKMAAFPTCFPGVTVPIIADESRITALDIAPDGLVYGGTSGRKSHVFVGMFHGVTGAVFDMGALEAKENCTAVCCSEKNVVVCANGADGGSIFAHQLQTLPFDLIQEWAFSRHPFNDLGTIGKGERIAHAVTDRARTKAIGISEKHLFTVDLEHPQVNVVAEISGRGRVALGPKGCVYGMDDGDTLWCFDPMGEQFSRSAVPLPEGDWDGLSHQWAMDTGRGILYVADAAGRLFSFDAVKGFSRSLGQVIAAPVYAMAVTFDGRLFGICGEGIGRLFCYRPKCGELTDLGVPVSVIERRRYGYSFADAVVGRDGEIIFGEDDNQGHLWLYFPRISAD
ncbi:MAG: hypothetical protein ABIH23_30820 [bacterium]